MKKTAQEYVYHAIDYMRKPTADVALSPIKDDDKLEGTYGFESNDICKLLNNIENDMEVEVPHTPIHMIKDVTVKQVVEYIEKIIKGTKLPSLEDGLFVMGALRHVSNMHKELIASMNSLQSIGILLKEEKGYKELEETLLPFLKSLYNYTTKVDKKENKVLLEEMRAVDLKRLMFENNKRLGKLYNDLVQNENN